MRDTQFSQLKSCPHPAQLCKTFNSALSPRARSLMHVMEFFNYGPRCKFQNLTRGGLLWASGGHSLISPHLYIIFVALFMLAHPHLLCARKFAQFCTEAVTRHEILFGLFCFCCLSRVPWNNFSARDAPLPLLCEGHALYKQVTLNKVC